MVYRGKTSAGCENCRQSKKRCTLEQPACSRCVRVKKPCTGYRNTQQLRVENETQGILRKFGREHASRPVMKETSKSHELLWLPPNPDPRPEQSSTKSREVLPKARNLITNNVPTSISDLDDIRDIPRTIAPSVEDAALNQFLTYCTINRQWFIHDSESQQTFPCLASAMKACGLVVLHHSSPIEDAEKLARSWYATAIGSLNQTLGNPVQRKHDCCLLTVLLLGFYEMLVVNSAQSHPWRTHMLGASRLLQLRGKHQLHTSIGQELFRTVRSSIILSCIWDSREPPDYLRDWNTELAENELTSPIDALMRICASFAHLRSELKASNSTEQALARTIEIHESLISWSSATEQCELWKYRQVQSDTRHVWQSRLHSYARIEVAHSYNYYRTVRILVLAMIEQLQSDSTNSIRVLQRQMTDEICAAIPYMLGHAPLRSSPCVLPTAYHSTLPIFVASMCALKNSEFNAQFQQKIADKRQAEWLLGRLDYISELLGIRYAGELAHTIRNSWTCYEQDAQHEPRKECHGMIKKAVLTWKQYSRLVADKV